MKRVPPRILIAFTVLALFLAAYIGAYCILARPKLPPIDPNKAQAAHAFRGKFVSREADYPIGGEFCRIFFYPLEMIDRALLPNRWHQFDNDFGDDWPNDD